MAVKRWLMDHKTYILLDDHLAELARMKAEARGRVAHILDGYVPGVAWSDLMRITEKILTAIFGSTRSSADGKGGR
jgi:hypothetical protein